MLVMYGIKNCDTIKKARKWLDEQQVAYEFFDYKKEGVSAELADAFIQSLGWESLINKRGTTWRNLSEDTKNNIDAFLAKQLMMENPSIIKRPLLDTGSQKVLGFKAETYQQLLEDGAITATP